MNEKTLRNIIKAQTNEITEYYIYKKLAKLTNKKNSQILKKISEDELRHYSYWKNITKQDVRPDSFLIWLYVMVSYCLGLSFGLRFMERGERLAQEDYDKLSSKFSVGKKIMLDEQKHEKELLALLEEEKLEYASSIVLGLNDALVELTGALAGLTFALQSGKLIAVIGLITGIAASMSMAASAYLSAKEEGEDTKKPLKSSIYTGVTYIITVLILVTPFFIINNVFISLAITLAVALMIIFSYTLYISVAKGLKFWKRFIEMALISLTVALISFGIGYFVKSFLGVDI